MGEELSAEQMLAAVAEDTGGNEAPKQPEGDQPTQGAGSHGQQQDGQAADSTGQVDEQQAYEFLDLDQYGDKYVKFKANGQEVQRSLKELLQNDAPKGYDYNRLISELKQKEPQYQEQLQQLQQQVETLSPWKQYDEYARQNPQWAKHVQDMWQNRHQYSNPDLDPEDPTVQQISQLQQTVEQLQQQLQEKTERFDSMINDQESQRVDQELDEAINSVSRQFPEIDLDQPLGDGTSMRNQVLQHMVDQQIPTFKAAFLDLFHDQVIDARQQAIRKQHADEIQKRHKQGIIGQGPTPGGNVNGQSPNVRPASYDQAYELAMRELGLNN